MGTTPKSTKDLEVIVGLVNEQFPDVTIEQLQVTHAGDDDGLWCFRLPNGSTEVQIESSNGTCPFLIESSNLSNHEFAHTPSDVAAAVVRALMTGD